MGIYGDALQPPEEPTVETTPPPPSSGGVYGSQVPAYSPLSIGGENYYMYDGDTIINQATNERIRLPNYDAGELSRIGEEFGEVHLGSFSGPIHKRVINDVIKEQGFNELVPVQGQTVDKYDRRIMDLVNSRGQRLSDYLHSERIINTSKFTTTQQNAFRHIGEFADSIRDQGSAMTSGDKARELVQSVATPYVAKDIETIGTLEDVYHGSGLEQSYLQAEINKINNELKTTKDEARKQELMEDLVSTQEALTISVNTTPAALKLDTFSSDPSQRKPGFWGESVNSAEKSLHMLSNSMGGFSAWLGDSLNNEALQNWGDEWALDSEEDIRKAGYTTDFWSIRNPYDALRFISNSIIQYSPQMGVIFTSGYAGGKGGAIAGTVVAGPAGTLPGATIGAIGAATTTAFMLAVSSVYQGQPEGEKDPLMAAAIAVPIALADRFGVAKLADINIFTKAGKKEYMNVVTKSKEDGGMGWTPKEAEVELKKGIKNIMQETAGVLNDSAIRQLAARKTFKDLALQASKAGAVEGFTEAVQQAIEEGGLAATTSIDMDYEQLVYNMIEAGAIGSVVGGAFNAPFAVREMDKHNQYLWDNLPEDPTVRTKTSLWEEQHRKANGNKRLNKYEVARKYNKAPKESLKAMADKSAKRNTWRDFVSLLKNPVRIVQQFRGFLSENYDTAGGKANLTIQEMGDAMGHIQMFNGVSPAQEYRALDSNWNALIPNRSALSRELGLKEKDLYRYLGMDKDILARQGLPQNTIDGIVAVREQFKKLGQAIKAEVAKRESLGAKSSINPNTLNSIANGDYFLSSKNIDYRKVDQTFKEMLMSEGSLDLDEDIDQETPAPLNEEEADIIMDEIRREDLGLDSRQKLQDRGVFNVNSDYAKYLSQKPWEDLTNLTRSIAKDVVYESRFGRQGEVFANMLNTAHKKGEISEQQKYDYAGMALDFMRMNRFTYKPVKNKKIKYLQDNVLFFSTLTYMDFNFFANMAEMANGLIGLSPKEMWKYTKTVGRTFTKQLANDLARGTKTTLGVGKVVAKRELEDPAIQRAVFAGTMAPKGTISYLEGADTGIPAHKNFLNHFWNWNQVENQTNAGRMGRGALAWDKLAQMISLVANEKTGESYIGSLTSAPIITNASRKARDHLNYYGLDPDRLAYLYKKLGEGVTDEDIVANNLSAKKGNKLTPEEEAELRDWYQTGLIRFTDEIVVRPEPGSTPSIIEDPHFALFTQFKRFISHFTANVIPRVWNDYLRSGKPAMTRQVFTVIMMAYIMAFLSQMIKDAIVYGEKAPWLEDDEEEPDWLRTSYSRAAAYTGWGGTPLMGVEFINDFRRNSGRMDPFEAMFESLIGESPVLNSIHSDVTSSKPLSEVMSRRVPFFGDIKPTRETIAELINRIGK